MSDKKNSKFVKAGKKAHRLHPESWKYEPEKREKQYLMKKGYEIIAYRGGYPDFLAYKKGKIHFIEVKRNNDDTSKKQEKILKFLKKQGFIVKVIRYTGKKLNRKEDKYWCK